MRKSFFLELYAGESYLQDVSGRFNGPMIEYIGEQKIIGRTFLSGRVHIYGPLHEGPFYADCDPFDELIFILAQSCEVKNRESL